MKTKNPIHMKFAAGLSRALAPSLVTLLALSSLGRAAVNINYYDDFSSGNLNKWTVDAAAGNTYSIASTVLTLQPSASPNYGYSTYTSTKSDFSFDRSTGNPTVVFFDMPANAFQRTVVDGGTFEEFNFGFKDSNSNTLSARILWNGSGNSRFDIFNNTTQLAGWWQGDITSTEYFPTAGKRYAFEWDGSTANVTLYNGSGIAEGTFVSAALSAPSFGNSGSIFFQFNTPPGVAAGNASISMDRIGVIEQVPEPSTAILTGIGLVGLLARTRRRN
jgi:hypothetical protein